MEKFYEVKRVSIKTLFFCYCFSYSPISGLPTIGLPKISSVNPTSVPAFMAGEPVCNHKSMKNEGRLNPLMSYS